MQTLDYGRPEAGCLILDPVKPPLSYNGKPPSTAKNGAPSISLPNLQYINRLTLGQVRRQLQTLKEQLWPSGVLGGDAVTTAEQDRKLLANPETRLLAEEHGEHLTQTISEDFVTRNILITRLWEKDMIDVLLHVIKDLEDIFECVQMPTWQHYAHSYRPSNEQSARDQGKCKDFGMWGTKLTPPKWLFAAGDDNWVFRPLYSQLEKQMDLPSKLRVLQGSHPAHWRAYQVHSLAENQYRRAKSRGSSGEYSGWDHFSEIERMGPPAVDLDEANRASTMYSMDADFTDSNSDEEMSGSGSGGGSNRFDPAWALWKRQRDRALVLHKARQFDQWCPVEGITVSSTDEYGWYKRGESRTSHKLRCFFYAPELDQPENDRTVNHWELFQAVCEEHGGTLAIIRNTDEQEAAKRVLQQGVQTHQGFGRSEGAAYLGAKSDGHGLWEWFDGELGLVMMRQNKLL
jgi:hypothetical protein